MRFGDAKPCPAKFRRGRNEVGRVRVPGMAWWTEILFLKNRYLTEDKELGAFSAFKHAVREYFYEKFVDGLHILLAIFTYGYIGAAVIAFFFQESAPAAFPYIVEVLADPYLGALGIYLIVKEIEIRRGNVKRRRGEFFALAWFIFLLISTASVYFFEKYDPENEVYKTIVTDSAAAILIRIGRFLR